ELHPTTVTPAQESVVRNVRPDTVIGGTSGDVILDGSATGYGTYGVFLRSNTAGAPAIGVKLGTSDATSEFAVFDSGGNAFFRVTPNGSAYLSKNTDAAVLEINNSNPGSGANYSAWSGIRFWEGSALKGLIYQMNSNAPPNPNMLRIANIVNAPMGFATNNTERMRIDSNGYVGVNALSPQSRLDVRGGSYAVQISGNDAAFPVTFRDMSVTDGYSLGVAMEMAGNSVIRVSNLQLGYVGNPSIQSTPSGNAPLYLNRWSGNDVVIGQAAYTNRGLRVESAGPSSFAGSLSVAGDLTVTGNIAAKYQDFAEWVPSVETLPAGTVVVLDREHVNHVIASSRAYDTTVAGVVSPQPGITLGEAGAAKALVATMGRVRVRVDASKHPVAIGDLLVTSGTSG